MLASALVASQGLAAGPGQVSVTVGPLNVSNITAVFVPSELATKYTVDATDTALKPGEKLVIKWELSLQLADKAGALGPGCDVVPGGGCIPQAAAVDPLCDNSKLGGGTELHSISDTGQTYYSGRSSTGLGEEFTWYHGDKGSYPGSDYGCDHHKMGPSGHQGVVYLTVTTPDHNWQCDVTMKGSNLSVKPEYSAPPTCESKLRTHLENDFESVNFALDYERSAISDIGSKNKEAVKTLERAHWRSAALPCRKVGENRTRPMPACGAEIPADKQLKAS